MRSEETPLIFGIGGATGAGADVGVGGWTFGIAMGALVVADAFGATGAAGTAAGAGLGVGNCAFGIAIGALGAGRVAGATGAGTLVAAGGAIGTLIRTGGVTLAGGAEGVET
jgi:hypothetical protein